MPYDKEDPTIIKTLTDIRRVMKEWRIKGKTGSTTFKVNWSQGGIGETNFSTDETVK